MTAFRRNRSFDFDPNQRVCVPDLDLVRTALTQANDEWQTDGLGSGTRCNRSGSCWESHSEPLLVNGLRLVRARPEIRK